MITKLRYKFIAISMISVVLVLFTIMMTINISIYRNTIKEADEKLDSITINSVTDLDLIFNDDFYKMFDIPHEIGRLGRANDSSDFYVAFYPDGRNPKPVISERYKYSISEEKAVFMANKAKKSGNERGSIKGYRYKKTRIDNIAVIFFVDYNRQLTSFHKTLMACTAVSLVGILAVFMLIIIFSDWIFRPVSESYEKQKRFITDAGHELKTPLATIDADVTVIEMESGENEWLNDIKMQTQRMAGLTNELVYLARMDEQNRTTMMIDFPLSDSVQETADSFQSRAVVENKMFNCNITPGLSYCGDEKAIRRLVSILLDNALKYSEENGTIRIDLHPKGKGIQLTIFNTTPSMPRESLKYLFDRFYRTDKSRNSETGGYGIGLSIAQSIINAHKGSITASTEDEKSLTIQITL